MSATGYTIRLARESDLPLLPEIERLAGMRFVPYGLGGAMTTVLTPPDVLLEGLHNSRLWVAVTSADRPVGFALATVIDNHAHLDELDVLPEHGQRGLGTLLVETVCQWARDNGWNAVTLSTLSSIPWNAPFYARHGFRILTADELTEALRGLIHEEAERGLPGKDRVIMRRDL